MKLKKRLPHLKTQTDVHEFWSRHSLSDYIQDIKEVDEKIQLNPELAQKIGERTKKKLIALRLEKWQLQRTKAIAAKRHIPYQHLLRYWISQGLRQEAAA